MTHFIKKVLTVAAFGIILNSSAMAGEEVDAFTLSFQNNYQEVVERDMVVNRVSYSHNRQDSYHSKNNVISMHYDSSK
ncbi:MAG: hypothetical protein KAH00_08715 [Cocleimonas sp.]|nr:hypothetical protein [Cocleimonas sp.]